MLLSNLHIHSHSHPLYPSLSRHRRLHILRPLPPQTPHLLRLLRPDLPLQPHHRRPLRLRPPQFPPRLHAHRQEPQQQEDHLRVRPHVGGILRRRGRRRKRHPTRVHPRRGEHDHTESHRVERPDSGPGLGLGESTQIGSGKEERIPCVGGVEHYGGGADGEDQDQEDWDTCNV